MKETNDLLSRLKSVDNLESLEKYLADIEAQYPSSFSEYMADFLKQKGISTTELIKRSKIERTYCYQILSGRKNPSREKIIAMALASKMSFEETQRALEIARVGVLYVKSKRDSVIIYALNNHMNILDTNSLLVQFGETELN